MEPSQPEVVNNNPVPEATLPPTDPTGRANQDQQVLDGAANLSAETPCILIGATLLNRTKGRAFVTPDGVKLQFENGQSREFRFTDLKSVDYITFNNIWNFNTKEGERIKVQVYSKLFKVGSKAEMIVFNQAVSNGLNKADLGGLVF